MRVSIIGLGYVGLPLFLLSEEKGIDVNGYDIDKEKVDLIKSSETPIEDEFIQNRLDKFDSEIVVSTEKQVLEESNYYIITVPTPVEGKEPDYSYVKSAVNTISSYLESGDTVVLESTVAPGTCRKIIGPLIEENTEFNIGDEVYLAFCPERVDPGNSKWNVENIPRVVGALTEEGRQKAAKYYSKILEAEIFEASSIEVAEASKVTENTFRDINIAFVNELAKIFDNIGISAKEVIEAAETKPFGFMAHWPGCGVGGHCIPVDPYYLIEESKSNGYDPKILDLAREVNESMPSYTVQKVIEGLNSMEKPVKGTKISLLGLAYKAGVEDTRMSPAFEIKEKLEELGGIVETYDPYVENSDLDNLEDAIKTECIVIATDHEQFKQLEGKDLESKLIVDGRNMLESDHFKCQYIGIGSK